MVARVLFAVASPMAISSCSPTRESSRLPVAGLTAQEQRTDAKTQRREERRKEAKTRVRRKDARTRVRRTDARTQRRNVVVGFAVTLRPCVFASHLGHNPPNVPAVSNPHTTASVNCLTTKLLEYPYQIACGTKPKPYAMIAAVPATRQT